MLYVIPYAFARRIKLKYHTTFNGIHSDSPTLDIKRPDIMERADFRSEIFFIFSFFLSSLLNHMHAAYYLSRSDPGRVALMKKKRV